METQTLAPVAPAKNPMERHQEFKVRLEVAGRELARCRKVSGQHAAPCHKAASKVLERAIKHGGWDRHNGKRIIEAASAA